MKSKKKVPKKSKQQLELEEANLKLSRIFFDIQQTLGVGKTLELTLANLETQLSYLEMDIEDAESFYQQFKHQDVKNEEIRMLTNSRKEMVKLIKLCKQFIAQYDKTSKLLW